MTVVSVGRRVELVSMDPHCGDISIALYRHDRPDGATGVVHTFSRRDGAAARIAHVAQSMATLAGLEQPDDDAVRFSCGGWHEAALRRAFLEACKLEPSAPAQPKPLEIDDRQSGQHVVVEPLGSGRYRVEASGVAEGETSRAGAVARGLAKLAQLVTAEDGEAVVAFDCGGAHDALVGLLLPRALNVRAALREEESRSSRGVLAAPSANQE
ncbi:MAG: hypothetical protein U0R50_00265 [Gaiellales bacterium]